MTMTQKAFTLPPTPGAVLADRQHTPMVSIMQTSSHVSVCGAPALLSLRAAINFALNEEKGMNAELRQQNT